MFSSTFGEEDAEQGSLVKTVEASLPSVLVVEQVLGFTIVDSTGFNPLAALIKRLKEIKKADDPTASHFQHFHVFKMDASGWLDISRPRTIPAFYLPKIFV